MVLVIATIVWAIALYHVFQEYQRFVEGLSEFERMWGLWDPWWCWDGMPYVIIVGVGLLSAWLFLVTSYLSSRKK